MFFRTFFLLIVILLFATSCTRQATPSNNERRADVENLMERTEKFLQEENESKIERFFSRDYYSGYEQIERKLERTWRDGQVLDLQLHVNRILVQDGLYNVQVKWNKTYLDATGVNRKSSGTSEFILKPHKDSFRILNVTGDHLF